MNVDRLEEPEILGCVAGDDTLLAVARTNEAAKEIAEKLMEML